MSSQKTRHQKLNRFVSGTEMVEMKRRKCVLPVTHGPTSWMRHVVCDFGSTSWMRHGMTHDTIFFYMKFYHLKAHTAFTI